MSELTQTGHCVFPNFISSELAHALREDLVDHQARGDFKRAGIGQGRDHQLEDAVRRDQVYWLSAPGEGPAQTALWEQIEQLRQTLNQSLFLGLREFEGHYAAYPAGGFYRRHRDTFRSDDARCVSLILYLNPDWRPEHGGQLRAYLQKPFQTADAHIPSVESHFDIEPREGTLVLFLSRELEHEVLPSHALRLSFTGWFKTAPSFGPT